MFVYICVVHVECVCMCCECVHICRVYGIYKYMWVCGIYVGVWYMCGCVVYVWVFYVLACMLVCAGM